MTSMRRIGTEGSKTRSTLLDAAEQLMCAEGYSAVTSRRLAAYAGLKPQLVHYYFRSMDDLFLDLFNRVSEQYLTRQLQLLNTQDSDPLQTLWDISCDHEKGVLTVEFMALANRRKSIRKAVAEFGERSRQLQGEIVARVLNERKIDTQKWPPQALAFILESVARALVIEDVLGQSAGHADTQSLVARLVDQLASQPAYTGSAKPRAPRPSTT